MKLKKTLAPWKKRYDQRRQCIKNRDISDKGPSSQSFRFSSMYGCESWTIKKADHWRTDAFWTVLLEKTLESPLDCKEIKPVSPKGNQSWIFIRRTDAETEDDLTHRKDPDAGKDWRQEKGMTEDKMVGWHHRLNGHEFEQILGGGKGQGSLACCGPWGRKESDTTEWLNNKNICESEFVNFFMSYSMLCNNIWVLK